jgi:hypothetical protein
LRTTFGDIFAQTVLPAQHLNRPINFDAKSGGAKSAYGIFGGLKAGPISWLAQAEITELVVCQCRELGVGRRLGTLHGH